MSNDTPTPSRALMPTSSILLIPQGWSSYNPGMVVKEAVKLYAEPGTSYLRDSLESRVVLLYSGSHYLCRTLNMNITYDRLR